MYQPLKDNSINTCHQFNQLCLLLVGVRVARVMYLLITTCENNWYSLKINSNFASKIPKLIRCYDTSTHHDVINWWGKPLLHAFFHILTCLCVCVGKGGIVEVETTWHYICYSLGTRTFGEPQSVDHWTYLCQSTLSWYGEVRIWRILYMIIGYKFVCICSFLIHIFKYNYGNILLGMNSISILHDVIILHTNKAKSR